MHEMVECVGAPRDQGLEQGLAFRGAVRDRASRAGVSTRRRRVLGLSAFASGPILGRGPGREMLRHYSHLAERAEGLALGADLRLESIVELMVRRPGILAGPAYALAATRGAGAATAVARSLPRGSGSGERWVLRRSRPEVGFCSVEVTVPWLAAAVAGVNDRGLAVALAPGAAPAVPSLLLQEILQRFGDLSSALDWCTKRPGSGSGSLLLGDAEGSIAAVRFEAGDRRIERCDRGALLGGPGSEVSSTLRKQVETLAGDDATRLPDALSSALSDSCPGAGTVVLLPHAHRLIIEDGRGDPTSVSVGGGWAPRPDAAAATV